MIPFLPILIGAGIGGAVSAARGGNFLTGALLGGMGGALGGGLLGAAGGTGGGFTAGGFGSIGTAGHTALAGAGSGGFGGMLNNIGSLMQNNPTLTRIGASALEQSMEPPPPPRILQGQVSQGNPSVAFGDFSKMNQPQIFRSQPTSLI